MYFHYVFNSLVLESIIGQHSASKIHCFVKLGLYEHKSIHALEPEVNFSWKFKIDYINMDVI